MTIKDEIIDMIEKKDAEEGESWSNDTESIVNLMVEFHKEKCRQMMEIIYKGTRNRSYYKNWETSLFKMLEEE